MSQHRINNGRFGNYANAQLGSIAIEQSGDDAKVNYRGNNRYTFSGYLKHFGNNDFELSYGKARGLPLQLQ